MASRELPPAHLDVLVNAGIQFGATDKHRAPLIGHMLRLENLRSVNIHDPGDHTEVARYVPRIVPIRFRDISVLAATRAYQQHTRHSLTWDFSPARTWIVRLRRVIATALPDEEKQTILTATGPMLAYTAAPDYLTVPDIITSLGQVPTEPDSPQECAVRGKGFPVSILTGPFPAPNGGLSAHARRVTILAVDGALPRMPRLRTPDDDAPGVYLRFEYGRHVARPLGPGRGHYAASGAFLHSSDGRWKQLLGHSLPIPLHDHPVR